MKKRIISFLLCLTLILAILPVCPVVRVHAATTSQKNIVARANYLYDATWVCQKTVAGWRGNYTFTKGNTYHIPYGQPVYAGAYVGFGVSVDAYLAAAADASSVFYTSKSNYAGKTSTYYATDCSAYVSWSWGIARQTTATIPNVSTYIGAANTSNIMNKLQIGDALNSKSAGHVVLVTGLTYNSSGTLTNIEITEQTPPQLKRTNHTPTSLANNYSASYSIYRYTGTVAAAPSSSSTSTTSFGTSVSEKMKKWTFDPTFYKTKYSDLASMTNEQLFDHFLDYGITEGRQGSALFDVKYYATKNQDLYDIYGDDYEAAFTHFIKYGQHEASRVYSKELKQVRDVIFDPQFYAAQYPSVYETYGDDVGRLFAHFIKTGIGKGYCASPAFGINAYIKENSGLTSLYANDPYGGLNHFLTYGQHESRVVSPILDTTYYIANYAESEGMDALDVMKHFLSTGLPEGKQGSALFCDRFYYFAKNSHLSGYTEDDCYKHYLLSGYDDGLRAAPYATYPETHADLGPGFTAKLTNLKSGLNWSIYQEKSVIIYTASDSDAQKWKFVRQPDGSYTIMNVKYGKLLTATDNGSAEGSVEIQEDQNAQNQRWFLYEQDGYYTFRTACNDWVSIGLLNGETTSENALEMAYYRANNNQKYTITVLSVDIQECTEHNYVSHVHTPASCITEGLAIYTCINCNDSYDQPIPATGHSNERIVTEATCTTDGITTCTCVNCGATYTEDPVPATGHEWQEGNCTSPLLCINCGITEGTAPGHKYEATVIAPTCSDEGYTSYICSACGDTYATPGEPATGHHYSGSVTAPGCTTEGFTTFICSDCGDTYTGEETPATGHSYTTTTQAPTCTENGKIIHTCTGCGNSYFDTLLSSGHEYADGICINCGATDPDTVNDPGLTMRYPTLSFEDEIFYNVYFTVSDMSSVEEMGLMLLSSRNDAATIDDAIGTVPGYLTNGTVYMVRSESVPAAYLGDTVYFKVYARLTDGSYTYSTAGGYNAKAYASSILSGNNTNEMKALAVAMLNYGAEAQLYFGHNTDKLVNASLTAVQKSLVAAYDEAMVDDVVKADSGKIGGFVRNNANFKSLYPSVSFDGAFAINFYCAPAITVDSGMTLYWWDAEDYANISMFTLGNATGKMTMTETNGQYWGEVSGIAAKDMDKTYYVSCVFKNAGSYVTTGIIPYSLGKYCESKAAVDGDAQQTFAQATAVYGYYAKSYFATIA